MISLVVCVDSLGGIGKDGKCLYSIPVDRAFYRLLTEGHKCVMGRKTWLSLPQKVRNRQINYVLTHKPLEFIASYDDPICDTLAGTTVFDIPEVIRREDGEVFVIGGASLFELFLPQADRIYLGQYLGTPATADTFFPKLEMASWDTEVIYEGSAYRFSILSRKP